MERHKPGLSLLVYAVVNIPPSFCYTIPNYGVFARLEPSAKKN
jgi:hypothetical protein